MSLRVENNVSCSPVIVLCSVESSVEGTRGENDAADEIPNCMAEEEKRTTVTMMMSIFSCVCM